MKGNEVTYSIQDIDFFFNPDSFSKEALKPVIITQASLNITKDRWVYIYMTWRGLVESKYFTYQGIFWQTGSESIIIEFDIPAPYDGNPNNKAGMEIGLVSKNDEKLEYEYRFYEMLKYGIIVYFAPKNALEFDRVLIEDDCISLEDHDQTDR